MKRSLLISGLIATVAMVFIPAGITSGELDLPGLNQAIDNLAARTTNNEQDIQALQAATSTTPAPHVDVPVAPTPAPVVTTAATTMTVSQPVVETTPAPATPAPTATPCVAPVVSPAPGTSIMVIGGCR